jgi:hypothetical protein
MLIGSENAVCPSFCLARTDNSQTYTAPGFAFVNGLASQMNEKIAVDSVCSLLSFTKVNAHLSEPNASKESDGTSFRISSMKSYDASHTYPHRFGALLRW